MKGVINGWMTRVRCHQVQWTFMCLVQLRLLMRFARWTGQFAALFDPSRDLPNFPELLILQNRKGQSVDALWPPAWDGSLRASPPVKGSRPIYPMETPNGVDGTVGGRFIPSDLLLAQDFTHEPACQTGERAPQGHFRHQPEQMVHPPFAWQLASFPSLPVCEEAQRYLKSRLKAFPHL